MEAGALSHAAFQSAGSPGDLAHIPSTSFLAGRLEDEAISGPHLYGVVVGQKRLRELDGVDLSSKTPRQNRIVLAIGRTRVDVKYSHHKHPVNQGSSSSKPPAMT